MRADAVKLVCICSSSYLRLHDDVRSLHTDTGKLHRLAARRQGAVIILRMYVDRLTGVLWTDLFRLDAINAIPASPTCGH